MTTPGDSTPNDMTLVEPDWSKSDPLEVLAQFAELAVVCAHYLLDYAGTDATARRSASMMLDYMRTEVAGVLQDQMVSFCAECGTSGPEAVMSSSKRHAAHRAREQRS